VRGIWEMQRGVYFFVPLPHDSGKRACVTSEGGFHVS
jgi:hypothetical protein